MNFEHLLSDGRSIAEIVGTVFAALNVLVLVQGRLARRDTNNMRRVIGAPDPDRTRMSEGKTLTEKVETLSDGMESLKAAFKYHVDKERSREIAQQVSELPGTGRRIRNDYPNQDQRGSGTQAYLE